MSIHYTHKTRSQQYRFTDTTLFINHKEYPYEKLVVLDYHRGNFVMNSRYWLLFDGKKKLVVGYKPTQENEEKFKELFDYIATFNSEDAQKHLSEVRSFEFLVDDDPTPGCSDSADFKKNIKETIESFFAVHKNFYLSDYVFDGEIALLDGSDTIQVEIFMYDVAGRPAPIGLVPVKYLPEMEPFLDDGTAYDIRLIGSAFGLGRKKDYFVRVFLEFDKRI